MSHKTLLLLSLVPLLYGQPKANLSRFVVAGDSVSAGFQNDQLISTSQVHGYANVIATQAGVSLNLPLVSPPGYPQIFVQSGFSIPVGYTPVPLLPTDVQPTMNLAIPGFLVADLVNYAPVCGVAPTNVKATLAAEILNPSCSATPKTQLQQVAAMHPTTSLLWIGSNDLLYTVLYGNPPTNLLSFAQSFHTAVTTLAQSSGHLVVSNVPDVTVVPYLISIPELASMLHLPALEVEVAYGLYPGDMVTFQALPIIQAMGTSPSPLPTMGPSGAIVIRAATVLELKATVLVYNAIIAIEAAANHATLVDTYSLVNNLNANGIVVNGVKLTTQIGGGLFSEDGIHPTNTGYAILANQFINTMNQALNTGIPPVSVSTVAQSDPLFP